MTDNSNAMIRDCDPGRDRNGLLSCIVEMQDFERSVEPMLPVGVEMANSYVKLLLNRCSGSSGRVFVADIDQTVVGFVGVIARVDPTDPDEEATPYTYISDLVVLPAYRRRGLGSALLRQAEGYARDHGMTLLRINVLAKNQIAGQLYRSFGFSDYRIQLLKRLG
jgi:ribosomal protein S18 acetylase RimI-like enzyme